MTHYTDKLKSTVVNYVLGGNSSIEAARRFKIKNDRTVRKWVAKYRAAQNQFKGGEPKILLWDVETSETVSAHFGMWNINVRPARVLLPSFMFTAAWKWYGQNKIESATLLDDKSRLKNNSFDLRSLYIDDYAVVSKLHAALDQADAFVYHNGDQFDLKKFNARAIFHGLKPISPNKIKIDTLKIARQNIKIESNSLDYLCDYFGIEGKMTTPKGMWENALYLCPDAIKTMQKYNEYDLYPSMEKLFERLSPYIKNLNLNLFTNGYHCSNPTCGGYDLEFKGFKYTTATRRRELQCQDCGKFMLVKSSDRNAEVRPC